MQCNFSGKTLFSGQAQVPQILKDKKYFNAAKIFWASASCSKL